MGALSRDPRQLEGLRVAVYGSGGAPWPHAGFAALYGASVRIVRAEDVRAGALAEADVLVMPGGGRVAMHGMLAPLGEEGAAAIRSFVADGGTYLSSCAGSVLPLALDGAAAELHPVAASMRLTDVGMANPGDATLGGLASPGVGVIRVRVEPSSPLAEGVGDEVELVHYNGPFFDRVGEHPEVRAFAWPAGTTDRFTEAERFLPGDAATEAATGERPTTFASCVARDAAGGMVAPFGDGHVVLFGSHPEFGFGPLLLGWAEGAQLLLNAFAQVPRRSGPGSTGPFTTAPAYAALAPSDLATAAADRWERVAAAFDRLGAYDDASWLAPGAAPNFLGSDPRTAWSRDRAAAATVAADVAERMRLWAPSLDESDRGWLDDRPRDDQDVGAMGIVQLADEAERMLAAAEAAAQAGPEPLAHAYDGLDRHPFHLAVGSYLSAAGLVAGGALQSAALAADRELPLGPLARHLFMEEAFSEGEAA